MNAHSAQSHVQPHMNTMYIPEVEDIAVCACSVAEGEVSDDI